MRSKSFSKHERLGKAAIRNLFIHHSKKVAGPTILLRFRAKGADDPAPSTSSMAISISKKIAKHAVTRNKIKRLIREVFRKNKDLFPTPYEYIFHITALPQTISYDHYLQEMSDLTTKITAS